MRFGGPVGSIKDPELWVEMHKKLGYSAAYLPHGDLTAIEIEAICKRAEHHNLLLAEVGAWSNPIDPNEEKRKKAVDYCVQKLVLAEQTNTRCCVNISGSTADQWDSPDAGNLTKETFELIVDTVRHIIDTAKPKRSFYTLEAMPWAYPDSTESYIQLIKAIDRKQFGVHFDPVNIINSPYRYYNSGTVINEFISKLGPYIKSTHAKDISLSSELTVHLSETRPGLGNLDYSSFLQGLNKLDQDTPVMMEHLEGQEEYALAAKYIRSQAKEIGIVFK